MSKDNGKSKSLKPILVNVAAHATIMQLFEQQTVAKSRIDLALTT